MHTRFSTRDHQRVAYDIDGPEDAPPVVLLHDLLGQRSSMASIRDLLGEAARTIAVDLRGHGASATISGASIDLRDLALDVAAVLHQEQVASAILVGHGLGAAVARLLAAQSPHSATAVELPQSASAAESPQSASAAESPWLITAVVAIEPPATGVDGAPLAESDHRAADLAYKGLADAALTAYLIPRLGPTWRDDLPRPTVAALRRHAPALATLVPALATTTTPVDVDDPNRPTIRITSEPGRLDLSPQTIDAILAAIRPLLTP